jgi:hypothetical protein
MYSELSVPFKRGPFSFEKKVEFLFNIGTIEAACDRLGIDFWQIAEHDSYDFTLAILFEGYVSACKSKFKKPKYEFSHSVYWMEHMGRADSILFAEAMKKLMGKLQKGVDGEKKK